VIAEVEQLKHTFDQSGRQRVKLTGAEWEERRKAQKRTLLAAEAVKKVNIFLIFYLCSDEKSINLL